MEPAKDTPAEEESQSSQIPSWWLKPVNTHHSPRERKSTPDRPTNAAMTPPIDKVKSRNMTPPAEKVKSRILTPPAEKVKPMTPVPDLPVPTPQVTTPEIKTSSKLLITQLPQLPPVPQRPLVPQRETPMPKVDRPRAATPPPKALTPPPPPQMTQLPPALQPSHVAGPSTSTQVEEAQKFNIVHFDPELHWCRVCNVFPRTAKEFLNHLHAPDHKQNLSVRKSVNICSLLIRF